MVSILKDIPIENIRIVPCRIMKSRGIVKSFLVEGDNRLILVDTEFSDADADIIMDGIKDMGRKHEELKLCVLTHRHGDHTGGLKKLKKDIEVSGQAPGAGQAGDTKKPGIRRGVRREGRRNDPRLWWHSSITPPRHMEGSISLHLPRIKTLIAGDAMVS